MKEINVTDVRPGDVIGCRLLSPTSFIITSPSSKTWRELSFVPIVDIDDDGHGTLKFTLMLDDGALVSSYRFKE